MTREREEIKSSAFWSLGVQNGSERTEFCLKPGRKKGERWMKSN